jgi:hypothetical protein
VSDSSVVPSIEILGFYIKKNYKRKDENVDGEMW